MFKTASRYFRKSSASSECSPYIAAADHMPFTVVVVVSSLEAMVVVVVAASAVVDVDDDEVVDVSAALLYSSMLRKWVVQLYAPMQSQKGGRR